jgi:hypothetical protein
MIIAKNLKNGLQNGISKIIVYFVFFDDKSMIVEI